MAVTPAELAQTLTRRFARRRALDHDRARLTKSTLLAALRESRLDGRVWLIGSLAWGGFGNGSDVDVVVEGLPPRVAAKLWSDLTTRVGLRVDLLRLEDLPPDFKQRVIGEGELLDVT